jgi:hypothetical protein
VAPLRSALGDLEVESVWVSWDDPSIEWGDFDRVLISGTWDSVDRPVEYLDWARRVAEVSTLINSDRLLEWNIDKRYLLDLAEAGVATIATEWVPPGRSWQPPDFDFVMKPSISAGGRSTACYRAGDPGAAGHLHELHGRGHTAMVQPHLESIAAQGEIDLVFIDGRLTHAFRRRLSMEVGAGVLERPWEGIVIEEILAPSLEQLALGQTAVKAVQDRLGLLPSYARVDLVTGSDASSLVVELELIDPYLALDLAPNGAHALAQTLSAT